MKKALPNEQSDARGDAPSTSRPIRHANNFQALRWLAATSVILAHSYGLRDLQGVYTHLTGLDLGWSAVVMFFTISGYLISASAQRRSALEFWQARFLRIFPGLIVCTLVTALVISAFSTLSFSQFITDRQTLRYIFGSGTLLSTEYSLPGAFQNHAVTYANGSLWTLRYEVASYFLVFVLFVLSYRTGIIFAGAIISTGFACALGYGVPTALGHTIPVQATNFLTLFVPFAIGGWFQASKRSGPKLLWVVIAIALAAALMRTPTNTIFAAAAISLLTLWLAFRPARVLTRLDALPDYSYGIYIYAYPIQQMTIQLLPGWHPLAQALVAFLATLVPASLSWHFIEKPAMALKSIRLFPVARDTVS
ncbi:acyltransferase family protein [Hyphomicrobium sp. DY-1]|uniref:acyltransferase family protein n=1 Tax=Hyphomicrobium sp. DY-1 TaxID=3075650 RepID=UPI0039C1D251